MGIERKLTRWQEAGVIDAATRERIEAFERVAQAPLALYALGVVGAGALALGVISVIAANWEAIPGRVKLGIDLLVGIALAVATYRAVVRGRRWAGEVLITVLYGFTLASIGLVGQVYQIDAPSYRGLLLWSAATAPLVLLGHSRYLAALALAGLALTHALSLDALFDHLPRFGFGTAAVENLRVTLTVASVLAYVLLGRLPWLVRHRPQYARTISEFAWLAVLILGSAVPLLWYRAVPSADTLGWSLPATGLLAALTIAALPRLQADVPPAARRTLAIILGVGWLILFLGAGFPRPAAAVVGAVLQIAWLALFARASLQLGLVRPFNLLTGLIALRVLVVYFELFGSLLSTGLGLITGGALTLLVGWLWRRKTGELARRIDAGEAHVA